METRVKRIYKIDDMTAFISQSIVWAHQFSHFNYFNPNDIDYPFGSFKHQLTVGCHRKLVFDHTDDFQKLKEYYQKHQDWLVGYLGYDLKNQLEELKSNNKDNSKFDLIHFYIPTSIIQFERARVTIISLEDPDSIFREITEYDPIEINQGHMIDVACAVDRDHYISTVNKVKENIIRGDVYELNYCIEFHADQVEVDPFKLYEQLISHSPTPFAVYQKVNGQFLIGASPERFIKKQGNKLISQPIKGTIKRGKTKKEDLIQQNTLKHSQKERAENMMIVDLVRNDLAKSCVPGSIKVEELFGIYPFRHLHQMISSVSGVLREDIHFIEAIRNAFPMGSMTGAPKVMAMQLIEAYESSMRGLFSGAVGYITPDGDFDFNVVIRSILYHAENKTLSFQVGSAITYDSDPIQEYEECMLKAKAIQEVLAKYH